MFENFHKDIGKEKLAFLTAKYALDPTRMYTLYNLLDKYRDNVKDLNVNIDRALWSVVGGDPLINNRKPIDPMFEDNINIITKYNILYKMSEEFIIDKIQDKEILDFVLSRLSNLIYRKIDLMCLNASNRERSTAELLATPLLLVNDEIKFDEGDMETNINLVFIDAIVGSKIRINSPEEAVEFNNQISEKTRGKGKYAKLYSSLLILGLLKMINENLFKSLNIKMKDLY